MESLHAIALNDISKSLPENPTTHSLKKLPSPKSVKLFRNVYKALDEIEWNRVGPTLIEFLTSPYCMDDSMLSLSISDIASIRLANMGHLVTYTPIWDTVGALFFYSDVIPGRYADIHMYVTPRFRKKPVMFSFIREILDYGFGNLCLKRIKAIVAEPNYESWRLCLHAGFKKCGVVPKEGLFSGVETDMGLYILEKEDRIL